MVGSVLSCVDIRREEEKSGDRDANHEAERRAAGWTGEMTAGADFPPSPQDLPTGP